MTESAYRWANCQDEAPADGSLPLILMNDKRNPREITVDPFFLLKKKLFFSCIVVWEKKKKCYYKQRFHLLLFLFFLSLLLIHMAFCCPISEVVNKKMVAFA